MAVVVDGQNTSEVVSGKPWVREPSPTGSEATGLGLGNVNPLTQIQALEAKGAKIKALGTSVIAGDTVSEFAIRPSAQEEAKNFSAAVANGQITPAERSELQAELGALGQFTIDVWLDGAGLMRRETVHIGGGSSGVSGQVVETFHNFGAPIRIAFPAASQVVAYSTFLKALQVLQGTTQ